MNYSILIIFFLSTIFSATSNLLTFEGVLPYKINGVAIFITTVLTCIVVFFIKPEKKWYIGRAVSESLKTLSWRFMMRSAPFDNPKKEDNITVFTKRMDEVETQAKKENFIIGSDQGNMVTITQTMSTVSQLDWLERKDVYLNQRINDQIDWYGKKSRRNKILANCLTGLLIFFQFFSAIYLFFYSEYLQKVNFNEVFIFLVTAILSIMELNKYRDLQNSYHLTKRELEKIANNFAVIKDEKDLSDFVLEAEQAISREHTMWLARRGETI